MNTNQIMLVILAVLIPIAFIGLFIQFNRLRKARKIVIEAIKKAQKV